MTARQSEVDRYLLGVTLVAALILGGGTQSGLSTDMAVQLLAIAAATIVCLRHMERPIDGRVFWFLVAAGVTIALQILPLGWQWVRSTQNILSVSPELADVRPVALSLGLGRTIEVAGYFLTLSLFLVAVLKLRFDQVHGLLAFFLSGCCSTSSSD